jgi:acyl-coenzyme A thioesterase PaaI-like protein
VGKVIEMRKSLLFSEADVFDHRERLIAHASSTCMPVPEGQGRE